MFLSLSWLFCHAAAFAQPKESIKSLAQALQSGDGTAAAKLVHHGKEAVPALIKILDSSAGDFMRGHAAHALGRIGPDAKAAVPALGKALAGDDKTVAGEAATALARIGPAATQTLLNVLQKDKSPDTRGLAAGALLKIGTLPKTAAPVIVAAFKNEQKRTLNVESLHLIDLLGRCGPQAKDAVPAMIALGRKCLKSGDTALSKQFRMSAVTMHILHAVGKLGPTAKDAVPFVLEVMHAKNADLPMYDHAISVLGQLGPAAKSAAPELVKLMQKENGPPRIVLLECLAKIGFTGDENMKPALYAGMRDKDAHTRVYSARILGQKYPDDLSVVSVLLESMRHNDADIRLLATETLAVVRPKDESVIEFLQNALKDSDARVRKAAKQTLKKYQK